MKNSLMISVAAIALIAGAGLANAQGGMKNESGGGATIQQNAPTGGAAATTGRESGAPSQAQSEEKQAPGAPKGQRAEEKMPGAKSKTMSSDNETKGGPKEMKAEGREDETNKNAETQGERSQMTTGQAGAGAKLSSEQRTKITTVIKNEHVQPAANANFSITVGTRVPREVAIHPLPAEVVTIYPEWRGYEFVMVRDQIVVIDPATLEIVAILAA